jgi:serine/threonine protein kinase
MVKDNLECCLSDFGMAIIHETHTLASESGTIKGSERWMAPETLSSQFGAGSAMSTPARDIYAFGCTILQVSNSAPSWFNVYCIYGILDIHTQGTFL